MMCGRTSLYLPRRDLERRFDAHFPDGTDYRPRFNIAPGEPLAVITNHEPETIRQFTWGLRPKWLSSSTGFINARSETAREKPAFRDAWRDRACLVPSSGFYEWRQPNGKPKQPYRVHREDDLVFSMAGLWESWESNDGTSMHSVTILTAAPNDTIRPIHDRMPVVLPPDEEATWLTASANERHGLCRPYPREDLVAYPVSTLVNDPANDHAQVIEPLDTHQSGLGEFG